MRLAAVALPDRALDRLVRACDLPFALAPADVTLADGELVRLESRRGSPIRAGDRRSRRRVLAADDPGPRTVDLAGRGVGRCAPRRLPGLAHRNRPGRARRHLPAGARRRRRAPRPLCGCLRRVRGRVGADPSAGAGSWRAGETAGGPRPGRRRGGEAPRPWRRGTAGRGGRRGRRHGPARPAGRARGSVALRGAPGAWRERRALRRHARRTAAAGRRSAPDAACSTCSPTPARCRWRRRPAALHASPASTCRKACSPGPATTPR